MRLIEADMLIEEIVRIDDLRKLSTATIGKALDAVPTIDAIPVEWLERTKENYIAVATVLRMWQKEQEAQDG